MRWRKIRTVYGLCHRHEPDHPCSQDAWGTTIRGGQKVQAQQLTFKNRSKVSSPNENPHSCFIPDRP